MLARRKQYYFGSYGIIRGYGALYRTLKEADDSVYDDQRKQQRNGGTTDRAVVAVSTDTGLCWWAGEGDLPEEDMMPVITPSGSQARYTLDAIRVYEGIWGTPTELAGFG